jgi:hypothetical protein
LLRKHELTEARRLLGGEMPAGAAFDLLRARRQYLIGFGQLTDGNRQAASEAMAEARKLLTATSLADDLRLDIDGVDGAIDLQLGRRDQGKHA